MSRYIDAERLYTELEQLYKDNGWERMEAHFSLSDMECNIHFTPTANVRENVTGKWIDEGFYADFSSYHAFCCSECGNHLIDTEMIYKYCPFCGARMEAE